MEVVSLSDYQLAPPDIPIRVTLVFDQKKDGASGPYTLIAYGQKKFGFFVKRSPINPR
jgi:hypothetical protein